MECLPFSSVLSLALANNFQRSQKTAVIISSHQRCNLRRYDKKEMNKCTETSINTGLSKCLKHFMSGKLLCRQSQKLSKALPDGWSQASNNNPLWEILIIYMNASNSNDTEEQFSMMISFWLILSFSPSKHLGRSIEYLLWVWNFRPKPRGQRKSCGTGINRFNIILLKGLWYSGVLGTDVWNVSEILFTNF